MAPCARLMAGKGIEGDGLLISWADLMEYKRNFTDPVPKNMESDLPCNGVEKAITPGLVWSILLGRGIDASTGIGRARLSFMGCGARGSVEVGRFSLLVVEVRPR
jgi:hypothetical protein